jgi:hypothetical protein
MGQIKSGRHISATARNLLEQEDIPSKAKKSRWAESKPIIHIAERSRTLQVEETFEHEI